MEKAIFNIKGMSCEHCVNKVETALQKQNGVAKAKVNLKKGTAKVKYDETIQTVNNLISEVKEVGYEAEAVR